jgi:(p)ppGpp synthase/HD superfamily hydrolase
MKDFELIEKAKEYAERVHTAARCKYGEDNEPYMVHLDAVCKWVLDNPSVLRFSDDFENTCAAAYTHDTIEDAQQTYNDVKKATSDDVADITLAVTDVHAENRMLRFLSTIPKTVKDYRALVLKVCDIGANSSYGKNVKNSMYKKYQKEWIGYKRAIFIAASRWYPNELNLVEFDNLIAKVDEILEYKSK